MARATRVVVDLGAGDGRAVGVRARLEPGALVIGIDANAAAMAEASRRAARGRGGQRDRLPSVLFVVAAAERPPVELASIADELSITMPWGSLLRGALALDPAAATGIASLIAPGGRTAILVSAIEKDGLGLGTLDGVDEATLATRWAEHGLQLRSFRLATAEELVASGSTWAKRLAAGRERPAWRIELIKPRD
jgi:16S rRNA (adenine(1408)-N(1))-methyltransferase